MVLVSLPFKSAEAVAYSLVTYVICPFSTPRILLSDQGAEFKYKTSEIVCHQYIRQTFTMAYRPASVGLVERTNCMLVTRDLPLLIWRLL